MTMVEAIYKDSFGPYRGNSFVEALPDVFEPEEVVRKLKGSVDFHASDTQAGSAVRGHLIAQLVIPPINKNTHK